MNIKIRKSIPDDVYGIREVQRVTWLKTYPNEQAGITLEDIENKFKGDKTPEGKQKLEERKIKYLDKTKQTWVAEDRDKIIGFCSAGKEQGKDRVLAIYVLPQYQGLGIGSKLIKEALGWLGGGREIYINVVEYNLGAISFYRKHGFTESGVSGTLDSAAKLPSGKAFPEIEMVKATQQV